VDLQRTLTSGDAEDHAKILLRAQGSPTIEVEISNACAYPQETWHVMGTAGGLRGSSEQLEWKWVEFDKLPPRSVDPAQAAADRRFNREDLPWQEQNWRNDEDESAAYGRFYADLYRCLRSGMPTPITPQSVRRTIAVLERCQELGRPSGMS
jgi:scyllo-inositol 2-dehydrogenase (NADP+)